MGDIKTWKTVAADNNAAPPDGAPEGHAPSATNNITRENMRAVRVFYDTMEWRDLGHTPVRVDADTFDISSTVTDVYLVGRPIRCLDGASTLYGYISVAAASGANTRIDVVLDSGSLTTSLSQVAVGFINTTRSVPSPAIRWLKGADIASAGTITPLTDGNYFDITGTTTISLIGNIGRGHRVLLQFDGALVLEHNATNLVLPGAENITTVAGDHAEFVQYDDGTRWRCTQYQKASSVVGAATAAEAEAASSNAVSMTPANMTNHPGVAKAYARFIIATGATGGAVTFSTSMISSYGISITATDTLGGMAMYLVSSYTFSLSLDKQLLFLRHSLSEVPRAVKSATTNRLVISFSMSQDIATNTYNLIIFGR